jgi:hypothetical protein
MPDIDFFRFFRLFLAVVVSIYASIITIQSLWSWYLWMAGSDRYSSLLRRYLLVHGLRLRFIAFWGDVLVCGLLCIAFFMLWHAQSVFDSIELILKTTSLKSAPHVVSTLQHS